MTHYISKAEFTMQYLRGDYASMSGLRKTLHRRRLYTAMIERGWVRTERGFVRFHHGSLNVSREGDNIWQADLLEIMRKFGYIDW